MATEIRVFDFTIPAGTTADNPAFLDVSFPPRTVDAIQVVVPPGPSGLVGWRILAGGVLVIPYLSADWVITAAENITWPLDSYPNSGSWQVQGYNTGTQDHTVYFRFLVTALTSNAPQAPQTIDESVLNQSGGLIPLTTAGVTG